MRIELRVGGLPSALIAAACLLTACPGKLANKAEFEAYAATHGDAGAPATSDAGAGPDSGASAGSAGAAGTSATGGTAGTAGTGGSTANGECGDVVARIFVPSCSGTGCHGSTSPQQDLDLESDGVGARVVGVSGKQCLQLLADPQNPEQSLLYQKLLPQPDCGAQMPLARPALSSADIACVLSWIAEQ